MKRLDRNGYAPSIYPDPWPTEGLVRHEIYFGHKCPQDQQKGGILDISHTVCAYAVHANEGTGVDMWLKRTASGDMSRATREKSS